MHPLFQRTLEAYRPVSLRGQMLDGVLRTPTSVAAVPAQAHAALRFSDSRNDNGQVPLIEMRHP